MKGCLSKLFFDKPNVKGDFNIKIPCKACGDKLKPNKRNSTTLKGHAMSKHFIIWDFLTAKRDGMEFSIGEDILLSGINKSGSSTILPHKLRDIRKFFKTKSVPYEKKTFQGLLTRFVVNNDQSLLVMIFFKNLYY